MSDGVDDGRPRIIAEVRSADGLPGLIEAFRRAVEVRNTTYESVSDLCGLPSRYVAKILSPVPRRGLGWISLGALLGALGVKLLMVDDEAALAVVAKRYKSRDPRGRTRHALKAVRAKKHGKRRRFLNTPGAPQLLHSRFMLLTTRSQRVKWAKRAARARWGKPRAAPEPAAPRPLSSQH